jgi:hypothetical protein
MSKNKKKAAAGRKGGKTRPSIRRALKSKSR